MVNYRGKFIPNLSSVLYPLNQLLRKDKPWKWTQRCQQAFQAAKDSLTSSKLLVHFDSKLPVILECDASQYGIGAVISHRFPNGHERPIAYASRSLNAAEKNYSLIHKEALAIVFSVTKFYMYLYDRRFALFTDHQPLLKILAPDSATPVLAAAGLQRWSLLLSSYTYDIEFRNSRDIVKADTLCRLPLPYGVDSSSKDILFQVSDWHLNKLPVSSVTFARETVTDPILSKVLSSTRFGWPQEGASGDPALKQSFCRRNELSIERECVMGGLRVITLSSLHNRLLGELHDTHRYDKNEGNRSQPFIVAQPRQRYTRHSS